MLHFREDDTKQSGSSCLKNGIIILFTFFEVGSRDKCYEIPTSCADKALRAVIQCSPALRGCVQGLDEGAKTRQNKHMQP